MICLLMPAGFAAERHFTVTLPDNWQQAKSVQLVLNDLVTPKNKAAILRAYADGPEPVLLGSYAALAQSRDAKGTTNHPEARIDITKALHDWALASKPGKEIAVTIVPNAGLKKLPDYDWSVSSVKIETSE